MTDETRDALLLAVAAVVHAVALEQTECRGLSLLTLEHWLARARHEIERPEDRG